MALIRRGWMAVSSSADEERAAEPFEKPLLEASGIGFISSFFCAIFRRRRRHRQQRRKIGTRAQVRLAMRYYSTGMTAWGKGSKNSAKFTDLPFCFILHHV